MPKPHLFLLTLVCGLFLMVQGCGDRTEEDEAYDLIGDPEVSIDLEEILERGYLIALVDNNSFSYFLHRGRPMGFEYELLESICKNLGVRLEIVVETDLGKLFERLNKGEGDLIAHHLTVTKARAKYLSFSRPIAYTEQVLVQRKPNGWSQMKAHEVEQSMIRNTVDLIGKEVVVRKSSSFAHRLGNLSEEVGGDIEIVEADPMVDTEELIDLVAAGEIDYTVADDHIAAMAAAFYRQIDISTSISTQQQIAWAVRNNAPDLLEALNEEIGKLKAGPIFNVLYRRYFNPGNLTLLKQDFNPSLGQDISPFDDLIKQYADSLGWDWKLLAAQVYKESRFDPRAVSWRGARGLLQIMPTTAQEFGVSAKQLFDPESNLKTGTEYLKQLERLWTQKVADSSERIKFILASYNAGSGHVLDARKLARKHGDDPEVWDGHVADWLVKKSYRKYYTDPVVSLGYCRGIEPYMYVKDIMELFLVYDQLVPDPSVRDSVLALQ